MPCTLWQPIRPSEVCCVAPSCQSDAEPSGELIDAADDDDDDYYYDDDDDDQACWREQRWGDGG